MTKWDVRLTSDLVLKKTSIENLHKWSWSPPEKSKYFITVMQQSCNSNITVVMKCMYCINKLFIILYCSLLCECSFEKVTTVCSFSCPAAMSRYKGQLWITVILMSFFRRCLCLDSWGFLWGVFVDNLCGYFCIKYTLHFFFSLFGAFELQLKHFIFSEWYSL